MRDRTRRYRGLRATVAILTILVSTGLLTATAFAAGPTALHVNFQPTSVTAPAGYTADTGAPYNGTSGWQDASGNPLNLGANTRVRHSSQSPDVRYDTQLLMQAPAGSGNTTPGRWVAALANGTYSVTVAVGDPTAFNSVYRITAQPGTANAVTMINNVVPTSAQPWTTVTKQVTVTGGALTLDPTGGTNTKIDFVDAVPVSGSASVAVSTPYDSVLKIGAHRLVYGTVASAASPAEAATFTNTGSTTLSVSNIAISGTNASEFKLDAGQATTLTIAPGGSANVNVTFVPVASTNCPTSSNLSPIGNVNRTASFTYSTNDTTQPTGSIDLAGVNACGHEGNYEPTLSQLLSTFGYTDKVNPSGNTQRSLGTSRTYPLTDEVQTPYFNVANSSLPVSLVPIAHYSGGLQVPYSATGWFLKSTPAQTPCNAATCKQAFVFPADPVGGYNQNQKIFPVPTGSTTFTPTGTFGIYSGENAEIGFSDDQFNTAHGTDNKNLPTTISPHFLHNMRMFPAYGPGHVLIPNTYLVAIDLSRVPKNKNNDYQDVVMLLSNVTPAAPTSTAIGTATAHNLAAGGTVSGTCAVTGFDGVLANNGSTPACNAPNIAFGSGGLRLTSTTGQLADGKQQNALYDNFDATKGQFTVKARIVGPITQLTQQFQQAAVWFGPDTNNFVKVEAEYQGTAAGTDPHLTMFYDEKGSAATVSTVSMPSLTTASTVDLVIVGNTQLPDPTTDTTYGVRNYPLAQVTAYYSINSGPLTQIGTVTKYPTDLESWFATNAKAGILVSGAGSATPVTTTFSNFTISAP
jgi:hypothetical protein